MRDALAATSLRLQRQMMRGAHAPEQTGKL